MKHVRAISAARPARAQLEPIILLVSLIDNVLALPGAVFDGVSDFAGMVRDVVSMMEDLNDVFGLPLPDKSGGQG
jgi:hypothetical protein